MAKEYKLSYTANDINKRLGMVDTLSTEMETKQDKLTFDTTPAVDSSNPVTSGGVYAALEGKQPVGDYATEEWVEEKFEAYSDFVAQPEAPEDTTMLWLDTDDNTPNDGSSIDLTGYATEDFVNEAISNIDIPEVEQVQPDWNQNDETAPDYVKNRPFYETDDGEVVKIDDKYLPDSSGGMIVNLLFNDDGSFGMDKTYEEIKRMLLVGNNVILYDEGTVFNPTWFSDENVIFTGFVINIDYIEAFSYSIDHTNTITNSYFIFEKNG